MKKYLAIFVAVIILASLCAMCACNNNQNTSNGENEPQNPSQKATMYVPDGAPALSVAKLINDKKVGNTTVNTVITTGEEVVAKCGSGEADMAVLPTNAAVNICTKRSDYLLFSVNVYGVLYIVGTEHIDSISELQGQTLYSIGLGNTPQYVFETICDKQGVSYNGGDGITVEYKTDASSIIPLVIKGDVKFALIGEPAVTQLKSKKATVKTLFDLQELWQSATDSDVKGYPQASMIVKKDLLTDDFAKELMQALTANSAYITKNCDKLSQLLVNAGSTLTVSYTTDLLDRCNLTVISAAKAKADINKYLSTFGISSISDSIYYEAKN